MPSKYTPGSGGRKIYKKKPEPPDVQGVCIQCSERPQQRYKAKTGYRYRHRCSVCNYIAFNTSDKARKRAIENTNRRNRPWRAHKKELCEECGFVPKHPCQLDVDHVDGNRKNNDPSNYKTLCANCHRLKTQQQKDYHRRKYDI